MFIKMDTLFVFAAVINFNYLYARRALDFGVAPESIEKEMKAKNVGENIECA
ncbi:MAG: hypothetical protein ACLFQK_07045 [Fibrobacterota bacterium]